MRVKQSICDSTYLTIATKLFAIGRQTGCWKAWRRLTASPTWRCTLIHEREREREREREGGKEGGRHTHTHIRSCTHTHTHTHTHTLSFFLARLLAQRDVAQALSLVGASPADDAPTQCPEHKTTSEFLQQLPTWGQMERERAARGGSSSVPQQQQQQQQEEEAEDEEEEKGHQQREGDMEEGAEQVEKAGEMDEVSLGRSNT